MSFNVHVHEGFGFVGHFQLVCKCIRCWYCNCLMCSSNTYDTPVKTITQPLNFVMKHSSFKLRFRNDSLHNHPTSQLCHETSKFENEISEQFTVDHATSQLTVFSWPKNWHVSSVISSSFTQPLMVWNPSKSNSITSCFFDYTDYTNYHQ